MCSRWLTVSQPMALNKLMLHLAKLTVEKKKNISALRLDGVARLIADPPPLKLHQ